jgi:hypothetical protein
VLGGALVALVTVGLLLAVVARARRRPPRLAEGTHAFPTGGAASASTASASEGDAASPRDLVEDGHRHEIRTWSFAVLDHELTIEDAAMGRGLDVILQRSGGELVVNGGFFDPEGKALGYALSRGAVLSRLARAASGGVLTVGPARGTLHEAESFALPEGSTFGIQCKPRLVVHGVSNVRRDDGKRSERTALCLRDGGATLDVVVARVAKESPGDAPGPSLFALAAHLAARGCEDALNLDGGPSTGFAARAPDGTVSSELPRGGVRHAIVVRRRR